MNRLVRISGEWDINECDDTQIAQLSIHLHGFALVLCAGAGEGILNFFCLQMHEWKYAWMNEWTVNGCLIGEVKSIDSPNSS